jgi:hypothetical protein
MIPVSIAVSIVLLQNLETIFAVIWLCAISPYLVTGYGNSPGADDLADRAKRRNLSGASRTSIYGGFHDCNAIGAMQAVVIAYYGKASENLDAATNGLFGDGSS